MFIFLSVLYKRFCFIIYPFHVYWAWVVNFFFFPPHCILKGCLMPQAGLLVLRLRSLGWFLCIFVFLFLALLYCLIISIRCSCVFPQGMAAYYSLSSVCTQSHGIVFLVSLYFIIPSVLNKPFCFIIYPLHVYSGRVVNFFSFFSPW